MQQETSSVVEAAIAQLEQELAMEKTQEDRQTRSVQGTDHHYHDQHIRFFSKSKAQSGRGGAGVARP